MTEMNTAHLEIEASKQVLGTAIEHTKSIWDELGFTNEIEKSRYTVLPRDQYRQEVAKLTAMDCHESRIDKGIPEQIAYSGAVVIPGTETIYMRQDYIDALSDTEGRHEFFRLAGGSTHEWIHRLTLDESRRIDSDTIDALGGEGSYNILLNRFSKFPELSFARVGPAIEIRSQGQLVDILSLSAVEFLADLGRYAVLIDSPGSPYSAKSVAGNIMYPGGLMGNQYNELAIEKNSPQRQIIHLLALLVSQSMSHASLGEFIRQGINDPFEWMNNPATDDVSQDVLRECTKFLFNGGENSKLGEVLNALITQDSTNSYLQEASEYIQGELF